MFSSPLRRACRVAAALILYALFAASPAYSQHTQHPADSSKKPMNMPMGAAAKKKPSTTQTKKAKPTTRKKKTSSTTPSKTGAATKKASTSMKMPMPADTGHMHMPSKPDSAHDRMPGMVPMPGMPGVSGVKRDTSMAHMQRDTAMVHPKSDTSMAHMKPDTSMGHMQPMEHPPVGPAMHGHTTEEMMIGPAGVSMERMGSGTTWIPDAVTLPSRRRMFGNWMVMAHGFVFAQYDHQSGERGDDQFGSLNWMMLMATRDLGGGRFQARTMLSLDPLTVTNRGYPLLLQSGETYKGEPLHDRQHPHDFWMELGALYQRPITKSLAWSIYAAPSGEPALGPVAFMHRPSAMDNIAAPISHHWQDATHVSFGVVTGGLFTHTWQLEGSVFNGREPNEKRWDFDPIKLDSYSGRLTINPNQHWSLAAGYGYLKSPEALAPDESLHRITASVLHGARIGSDGQVSSAFVWGANKNSGGESFSNSYLLESEAILDRKNTLFGRGELVQKNAEDLVVADPVLTSKGVLLPGFPPAQRFNVAAAQFGYIRELMRMRFATLGLGAAGTLNFVPGPLESYYGSRSPVGTFVFLRLRPFHSAKKAMSDMGGMKMGTGHD